MDNNSKKKFIDDYNLLNISLRIVEILPEKELNLLRLNILRNILNYDDFQKTSPRTSNINEVRKCIQSMIQGYYDLLDTNNITNRDIDSDIMKFAKENNYNQNNFIITFDNLLFDECIPKDNIVTINQLLHDTYVMNNIKKLSLNDMNLNKIPQRVYSLKNLKVLDLTGNNIKIENIDKLKDVQIII